MSIKLSIAIPTYNRASFLHETLETILPQIREGMEIVVSDNGSTDETLKCVKQFQKQYRSMRLVGFDNNQGIDRNIVNVIKHSLGEYIFLFSDDDLLMPDSIDRIMKEIEKSSPMLICLNHFAFRNHDVLDRTPSFLPRRRRCFTSGAVFFKRCGLGFLSSLIFRREEACQRIPYVRFGKECAHLDILSRVALQEKGCFVYLGEVSVAGRSLEKARYDLIDSCVLYPKELYDELLEERCLVKSLYNFFVRRLVYKDVVRILYKLMKEPGYDVTSVYEKLKKGFRQPRECSLLIYLLSKTNKKFLVFGCHLVFFLIKIHRKIKLKMFKSSIAL